MKKGNIIKDDDGWYRTSTDDTDICRVYAEPSRMEPGKFYCSAYLSSNKETFRHKLGFKNIQEAFEWADNQVDYTHVVFKDSYIKMLMRKK